MAVKANTLIINTLGMNEMRRRDFLTLGAGVFYPLAVQAQPKASPVIGFLSSASANRWAHLVKAFGLGLGESGFADGRNAMIEYRWAEDRFHLLPALAADLVNRGVAVIVAAGGSIVPLAAKAATSSIPIVFVTGGDPVATGIVPRLNRPNENVTGITSLSSELTLKRLELLRELLPHAAIIGQLQNPENPASASAEREIRTSIEAAGLSLVIAKASSRNYLEAAISKLAQQSVGALVVGTDPLFVSNARDLASLCAIYRVPAIYSQREYVLAGGLVSYGSSFTAAYRQAGLYVGRILHGERPGDLPVMQPTTFEISININTAKLLNIEIPVALLARADEVIE